MAASRRLSPLAALTVNLINKVGAARYRWAAQYFSVAKEKRAQQGFAWTQDLDLARNQAMRSIPRSMGPAEPKLDLAGQGRCWPLRDSRALAPPLPGRDGDGSKLVPAMRRRGGRHLFSQGAQSTSAPIAYQQDRHRRKRLRAHVRLHMLAAARGTRPSVMFTRL